MPQQVLFVQGGGEGTHDEWDHKLVASLRRELGEGYAVHYPRMPGEDDPRYSVWKQSLLNELARLDDGAIVVGHSLGGAFLLHVLAEEGAGEKLIAVALLAAPFIGEGGWPNEEMEAWADVRARLPAGLPMLLYQGTADEVVPFEHLALNAQALPGAVVRPLAGRDHQLGNDLGEVARDIRALGVAPARN